MTEEDRAAASSKLRKSLGVQQPGEDVTIDFDIEDVEEDEDGDQSFDLEGKCVSSQRNNQNRIVLPGNSDSLPEEEDESANRNNEQKSNKAVASAIADDGSTGSLADSKNRSRQVSKVPLITPNQNVDSLNNLADSEDNEQAIKAENDAEYASSPNKMDTINETEEDGPPTGQKD